MSMLSLPLTPWEMISMARKKARKVAKPDGKYCHECGQPLSNTNDLIEEIDMAEDTVESEPVLSVQTEGWRCNCGFAVDHTQLYRICPEEEWGVSEGGLDYCNYLGSVERMGKVTREGAPGRNFECPQCGGTACSQIHFHTEKCVTWTAVTIITTGDLREWAMPEMKRSDDPPHRYDDGDEDYEDW